MFDLAKRIYAVVIDRERYGKTQIKEFSITAAADAGLTTIATITDQPCFIESVILHSNGATTGDFTKAAITGGVNQVASFIPDTVAIRASLDVADKQVSVFTVIRLAVGKLIEINLTGGGSTPVDFTVTIKYQAIIDGGYLV